MSRLLVVGHTPPPMLPHSKIEAAHFRTWQFLEPLIGDGHNLCLCVQQNGAEQIDVPAAWADNVSVRRIPFNSWGWARTLQACHDAFQPDCIVAVNFDACLYATKLATDKPIWMDIYGDYLTIVQAARYRAKSNRGLTISLRFVGEVLQRGDVFSTCGTPQRHMLVGELAMAGRLSHRTFGYDFARVILPGAPRLQSVATPTHPPCPGISPDAFVVLWCGGYNTWMDVGTLFRGLSWAMERNPAVHYLSVGASTYRARRTVYDELLDMIKASPFYDRFHMLGWRPWSEIASYYHSSHVGLNIDAPHYETLYGTRTRLLEMAAAGLPVITSLGAEISHLLEEQGAALTFAAGDWPALGAHILELSRDPGKAAALRQAAEAFAGVTLSFAATTAPLRAWVNNPQLAPDRAGRREERWRELEYALRGILRGVLWKWGGLDQ